MSRRTSYHAVVPPSEASLITSFRRLFPTVMVLLHLMASKVDSGAVLQFLMLTYDNSQSNDWDGSFQGNKVPTGTYFYILDTGTDKGKYKGTVTIMR